MDQTFTIRGAVVEVLQSLAHQSVEYTPRLITALVLLLIGFAIAKVFEILFGQILSRAGLDALLERTGLAESLRRVGIRDVSRRLIPRTLFWLALLVFVQSGCRMVKRCALRLGVRQ